MATYKQRTPLNRHTHIDEEEDSYDTTQHQHQHQHQNSYPYSTHTIATPSNILHAPGYQQQLPSVAYYHGSPHFSIQNNSNNDTFPSTATSFDNTASPIVDLAWASIGEPSFSSSSSQRKSRHQQQQQLEHQEQQQQWDQEWHFVLNQPSRRRQLQLQQQRLQQQRERHLERAPLSITLNGGGDGVAEDSENNFPSITVPASREYTPFFSTDEDLEEEVEVEGGDDYPIGLSASSSVFGEDYAEPARSHPSSMELKDEDKESEKVISPTELTAPLVPATPSPIMFLNDDTASSLDFAFSDLTSEHEYDHRSLWSQDDEDGESYYSSPSPYNVAGYPPFGYGYGYNHSFSSSFNKKAASTISTSSPSATSYNSTPLLQTRQFPSSPSGASLRVAATTPHSSSNSLNQLLFNPTLPPQQQPQQSQYSSLGREWSRFQAHHTHQQSQMPFHDGSGNFVLSPSSPLLSSPGTTGTTETRTVSAGVSESGSDLELDLYPRHRQHQHLIWGSKPQQQQQQQQQKQNDASVSGGGGASRSKKMMMMTMKERKMLIMKRLHNNNGRVRSISPSPSSRSTTTPRGGERVKSRLREGISMYDSEEEEDMKAMEEMNALVVDIPATMGWLQVFEQALNTFRTSFEVELQDSSDSGTIHPIRAWANRNEDDTDTVFNRDHTKHSITTTTTPTSSSARTKAIPRDYPTFMPISQSIPLIHSPKLSHERDMIQVKRQMSASSLHTLQRLQSQRHHSQHHYQTRRHSLSGTQGYHHRQGASEDDSNDSSSESSSSSSSTTLLEAAISALRRFRDHVKSNLMDPALDEELESDLSRLGFGGDLGMVAAD